MTFPFPIISPSTGASIVATDNAVDATDTNAYTFTTRAIGAASSDRVVLVAIVAVNTTANRTVSSVTVDGNSATQVAFQQLNDGIGSFFDVAIYGVSLASGTTATIVVTWSGAQLRCGIGVWAAYNVNSLTATATANSSANPFSASLAVDSGGIAVGGAICYAGGPPTYTWANMTENYDETLESPASQTGASFSTSAATNNTITCTPSSFTSGLMLLAALR